MQKEELENKIQETIDYANRINSQIEELQNARQQLIGRLNVYQELLQELNPPVAPTILKSVATNSEGTKPKKTSRR